MKLRITHQTNYVYPSPVHGNSNEVRLTPKRTPWQQVQFCLLKILPTSRLKSFPDFHGNTVSYFEVEEPHSRLEIEASTGVITSDRYETEPPPRVRLDSIEDFSQISELQYLIQPTGLVPIPPEIWRAAIDVRENHGEVFELGCGLMRFVYEQCSYTPGVTAIHTTAAEFFQTRQGVCQDFSHLMLSMCRALQLPARYVSGYVYDAKRETVRGAHASHAWVEIWIPGAGWYGFDPTNNCVTGDRYVVVAVGRDYNDVTPVRGSFWGSGECRMDVSVHIEAR